MKTVLFIFSSLALFCVASAMPAQLGKDVNPPKVKPEPVDVANPLQKPVEEKEEPEGDEPTDEEIKEGDEEEEGEESDDDVASEKQKQKEEEEDLNSELNDDLFEGDLKLSKDEIEKIKGSTVSKKDAVSDAARRWTNARVPYQFDRGFDARRREIVKQAIAEFNKKTCVKFVPRKSSDRDYITFIVGGGCYSTAIGKHRGGGRYQKISIGSGCTMIGTVIHEMMHAIGFFHEHTRLDRDQYVTVNWDKIKSGKESQFQKYNHGEADYLGEPYDYDSVMHYPRWGFGINEGGKPATTLIPKDKPWRKIGQREGFSDIDLRQINKLYKCTKFTSKY